MSARRVLLNRDWMLALLAVLVATAVCVSLGFWQYGRFEQKQERRDLVAANYSAPPADLGAVLPETDSALAAGDGWRTVRMSGHYCTEPGCVLYVRNRPLGGDVGFWQLVPFVSDQGTLLVVRGWVPMQPSRSDPLDPPPVPSGPLTITVRMRPDEPVLTGRTNPPGQVQTVTPTAIAPQLPDVGPVRTGAYGELASETAGPGAPAPAHPEPLERPDVSLGPHLSYAVQWWLFALFFPIAWIARARRAVLDARAETDDAGTDAAGDGSATPARPSPARRSRPRSRDEEEEDAILDERRR